MSSSSEVVVFASAYGGIQGNTCKSATRINQNMIVFVREAGIAYSKKICVCVIFSEFLCFRRGE